MKSRDFLQWIKWCDFKVRERLLSRLSGDPTVESLRSKKESCSMWIDLRVDSGFRSFRQTP